MDQDPPADQDRWNPAVEADPDQARPGPGAVADAPEASALAAEAEEIRRLVDAGAGSPDELRALAERLRAHRAREEALWRTHVKPTLKPKRGGVGGGGASSGPSRGSAGSRTTRQNLLLGLALLGAVLLVVLLAASTSVLWVLLPVAGVLGAAWWQGKQSR